MKLILNKYRANLTFKNKDLDVINKAIENKIILTDDLIEDFWIFRDKNLDNWDNIDDEQVMDFNEHYNNGLTHIENFINLIIYLDKNS